MSVTTVTGVGKQEEPKQMHLGVSRLIGPRWNEEKEQEFIWIKKQLKLLFVINIISSVLFTVFTIILFLVFYGTRWI